MDAGGLHLLFNEGLQLLDDEQGLHLVGELPDFAHGQGEGETQLQIGDGVAEDVLGILVGHPGGDDADLPVIPLHPVQLRFVAELLQLQQLLLHHRMQQLGVARVGDELIGLLHVIDHLELGPVPQLHDALGVADSGGHAEQHGHVEALADVEGRLQIVLGFLGIAGLDAGHLGELGVVAVVLLVLGAVAPGVVGGNQHQSAGDAGIGDGEQGVGRHVDTDMLHGRQGTGAGHGGPDGVFHGHLLVGGPFALDSAGVQGGVFKDFRAGRAGIGGGVGDAGLKGSAGNRFVACHQYLLQSVHLFLK